MPAIWMCSEDESLFIQKKRPGFVTRSFSMLWQDERQLPAKPGGMTKYKLQNGKRGQGRNLQEMTGPVGDLVNDVNPSVGIGQHSVPPLCGMVPPLPDGAPQAKRTLQYIITIFSPFEQPSHKNCFLF